MSGSGGRCAVPAVQIGVQARYTYHGCTYYTNLLLEVPYLLWLYCYGYTDRVHQRPTYHGSSGV